MSKAKRKPRPAIPDWAWRDRDGCWFCKHPNNCNQCKSNREFFKYNGLRKVKGGQNEQRRFETRNDH